MDKHTIPSIYSLTASDNDVSLINKVATIETEIQPFDSWNTTVIKDLLIQDINHCWVIMEDKDNHKIKSNDKLLNQPVVSNESDIEITETNIVVAYCIFSTVFEVAEILRIGTHPNFQRRGYAELLLRRVIQYLSKKGLEKILLEVRSDNQGAIKLYEKLGFTVIHIRKNYYAALNTNEPCTNSDSKLDTQSRCDALIMERKL